MEYRLCGERVFSTLINPVNVIEPGRLQIYEVERSSDLEGVCIVRCIGGVVRRGQIFVPEGITEKLATDVHLTITEIEWYGKNVDFIDPPHAARVYFSGGSVGNLTRGSVLTGPAS